VEYKMYALPSNFPNANCLLSQSIQNRPIEQLTSILTFLVFLNQIQSSKHKDPSKNLRPKKLIKDLGVPRRLFSWSSTNYSKLFFKFLVDFFCNFLTFDGWNSLRRTNTCFCHRRLPARTPKFQLKIPTPELSDHMIELIVSSCVK